MQKRQVLRWMLMFLFVCTTFVTSNINVAIISMTRPSSAKPEEPSIIKNVTCPNTRFFLTTDQEQDTIEYQEDTLDWTSYEKRVVLSAFHWLSWLSILPGSIAAQKYGSKIVVGYTLCISAVLSSSIPYLARLGASAVMYVRMVQGILSFIAVPGGMITIVGNWSSKGDRGRFVSMFLVGSTVGSGLGSYIFGYIGRYLHWKYIFHLTSLCGIIWTLVWYFFIFDYPSEDPTISIEEKIKILKSRTPAADEKQIPIPWFEILTSVPVVMCNLFNSVTMYHFFVLVTFIPLYLHDTYGLDSNEAGIITCLPQILCAVSTLILAWFTDYVTKKQWLSLTRTRKLFALLSISFASIPMVGMAFIDCDLKMIVFLYTCCVMSRTFTVFVVGPIVVDMSPKFCGILEGRMGTEAEIITLALSTGMNYLSKSMSTEDFWKAAFLSTAVLCLMTVTFFFIWGSAEVQSWNEGSQKYQKYNQNKKRQCLLEVLTQKTEF